MSIHVKYAGRKATRKLTILIFARTVNPKTGILLGHLPALHLRERLDWR